ncbi:MAG: ribosome maturation factor RimM [Thermodesulfobacteriota bacterium]|nr:ribosome maturation factor RimM [Thermodesulfobacteriota bacterium]
MTDLIEIGKVVKSNGLKGRIKAASFCESPELLISLKEVFLGREIQHLTCFKVEKIVSRHTFFLLDLDGVKSRDASDVLIGCYIFVPSHAFKELPEGEYYWHDIIGLEVITDEGLSLGRIETIVPTGSNDVYVCAGGEREVLLPAVDDVIKEIDVEKGIMVVTLIEGL